MKEILIMTDSSSDLPIGTIEKYDIKLMHFAININGKTYTDGIDVSTEELFKLVDKYHELPKTAAFSSQLYVDEFAKYATDYDILFIGLGSDFSSSFNSATLAAEQFDNVYLVDSCNLSAGVGLLVLKACKLREQGKSIKEIVEEIKDTVPRVRTQFVINTLEYLHMGGRCSGMSKVVGTILGLKPIIRVKDGKMIVAKKPLGFNKGLSLLLDYVNSDIDNLEDDYMTVTHCLAPDDAQYLISQLKERNVPVNNIVETYASTVISAHCGPRTIGILYILKK